MSAPPAPAIPAEKDAPRKRGRFERFVRTFWWLHSLWALAFGVGVMIFARKGLAHADKLLIILGASWLLVFFALRLLVGPDTPAAESRVGKSKQLAKRGLKLATNYVIKNLYQQMLFFLVPLYAASTSWSWESQNWWMAPVLLGLAVLSTLDLVMDNFIMQRRLIAAAMYAVCMLGVLNLMLPIALGFTHHVALVVAAAAAPVSVALLTFRIRQVLTARGLLLTAGASGLLALSGVYGAPYVPPAPLAMVQGGVSHGTVGSRELVPGHTERMSTSALDGLRCVTRLSQPGGIHDEVVHRWIHNGSEWFVVVPQRVNTEQLSGLILKSSPARLPANPRGQWACAVETEAGQLIGRLAFEVVD